MVKLRIRIHRVRFIFLGRDPDPLYFSMTFFCYPLPVIFRLDPVPVKIKVNPQLWYYQDYFYLDFVYTACLEVLSNFVWRQDGRPGQYVCKKWTILLGHTVFLFSKKSCQVFILYSLFKSGQDVLDILYCPKSIIQFSFYTHCLKVDNTSWTYIMSQKARSNFHSILFKNGQDFRDTKP